MAIAAIEGHKVVEANDTVLQLDIDSKDDLEWAVEMLLLLKENNFPIGDIKSTRSKSGNFHIYVEMKQKMPWSHRILLQACLGSDRKRELLNFLYRYEGGDGDCLLFEVPEAKEQEFKLT